MTTELQSRLVFIDTSAFERKNYQFGKYKLEQLCGYLEENKLHLLTTEVTINEVKKHIKNKSQESAKAIRVAKKEAALLRNTPELACFGIFTEIDEDEINRIVSNSFDEFIVTSGAEIVPINIVDASDIFDLYFNEKPPFSGGNKKHEFPDAFVLEAVRKVSEERQQTLYVVSCDNDMQQYANEHSSIIHINTIDELIDLVIRNEDELSEPVDFADRIFSKFESELLSTINDKLLDMEFYPESSDYMDVDVDDIKINNIKITDKKIVEVDTHHAIYEIDIEIQVTAEYSIANYENSPWDPEDKKYIFIVSDKMHMQHVEEICVYVHLNYEDAILHRASIDSIEFSDSIISLDLDSGHVISHTSSYDPYDYEE
jgi:hypothetical protein